MGIFRKKPRADTQPARRKSGVPVRESRATEDDLVETYAFRRNRTLTGSLAPHVASASETHAELRSTRLQAHDLRHRRRHLLRTFLIVGLVIAALLYVIYQSIALPLITVVGATTSVDTKPYQDGIQAYLNGHPLERLRSTINIGDLTTYLQQHDCPEVAAVSGTTTWNGLGATGFTVTLRRPVVSWRTNATTLYYVDAEGNTFTRNYFATPAVQVIDQSGVAATTNRVLTSGRFLSFLGRVIGRMQAEGLTVTKVTLPAETTHQVQLTVDGVGYPIKFSVDRPAGEQAEDATRAVKYLNGKGIVPEYLDVRVSGKAYYK